MNKTMLSSQRGISFGGFILGAFLLVLFSLTALKMVPPFIQNATINNLFVAIAHDPEMQNASLHDIRASFDRRASVDDITAITAEDIDIENNTGTPVLSANYSVKVPLVANVSLFIDFHPTSAGQ